MKITVKKYDPTVDAAPHYVDYDVPFKEYMTLLEALVYIDESREPLAFDFSCRGRICGRCAMMLDGIACTACTKGLTDGDHVVEPLERQPVIRDLVVDKTATHDKLSALSVRQWTKQTTWEDIQEPIDPHDAAMLYAVERCARCLVCQTSCPVVRAAVESAGPDDYVGPAGMIAIALRYYDPYDEGDRVLQAVNSGLWNCTLCGTCDAVCPALEIEHVSIWNELREAATARGLTSKVGSALTFGEKH